MSNERKRFSSKKKTSVLTRHWWIQFGYETDKKKLWKDQLTERCLMWLKQNNGWLVKKFNQSLLSGECYLWQAIKELTIDDLLLKSNQSTWDKRTNENCIKKKKKLTAIIFINYSRLEKIKTRVHNFVMMSLPFGLLQMSAVSIGYQWDFPSKTFIQ